MYMHFCLCSSSAWTGAGPTLVSAELLHSQTVKQSLTDPTDTLCPPRLWLRVLCLFVLCLWVSPQHDLQRDGSRLIDAVLRPSCRCPLWPISPLLFLNPPPCDPGPSQGFFLFFCATVACSGVKLNWIVCSFRNISEVAMVTFYRVCSQNDQDNHPNFEHQLRCRWRISLTAQT